MTGYAMAGTLPPPLGNSEHCGWASPPADPQCPDAYWFPASDDERFVVAHEHIAIAGADNYELVQQSTTVNGRYCPVVASDEQRRLRHLHDVRRQHCRTRRATVDMYGARGLGEMRQAFRRNAMFPQNMIALDVSGANWYVRAGRVPVARLQATGQRLTTVVTANGVARANTKSTT